MVKVLAPGMLLDLVREVRRLIEELPVPAGKPADGLDGQPGKLVDRVLSNS